MTKNIIKQGSSKTLQVDNTVLKWAAIGVAITLTLIVIGFFSWRSAGPMGPGSNLQKPTAQDTANNAVLKQLATKSQGNFSNLSVSDQAVVNQITHGHGQMAIIVFYKQESK